MDIKALIVEKLDVDNNGKVNYDDAVAKFGVLFVRGFLIGGGILSIVGFIAGRMTK